MAIKHDLRAYLLTRSAVTDLVATRIYCGLSPQGTTLPYVVINQIDGGDTSLLSGPGVWGQPTLQVSIWYPGKAGDVGAATIAAALKAELHGQAGTWNGTRICECELTGERDLPNPDPLGGEAHWYHVAQEYRVLRGI